MRKSMKQRVALFLSFAMAFTSVDSSVLVAAADTTEVVSEETQQEEAVAEEVVEEELAVQQEDVAVEEEPVVQQEDAVVEEAVEEEPVVQQEDVAVEEVMEEEPVVQQEDTAVEGTVEETVQNDETPATDEAPESEAGETYSGDVEEVQQEENVSEEGQEEEAPVYTDDTILEEEQIIDNEEIQTFEEEEENNTIESDVATQEMDGEAMYTAGIEIDPYQQFNDVEIGDQIEMIMIDETSIPEGVSLSYKWYHFNKKTGTYDLIESEEKNSYTVTAGAGSEQYMCTAEDNCGNTYSKDFVWYMNTLKVDYEKTQTNVKAPVNGEAVLELYASSSFGEITYHWKKYNPENDTWTDLEGETASTLHVNNVSKREEYDCYLSDGNDNVGVRFSISVDPGIKIDSYQPFDNVKIGDQIEMIMIDETSIPEGASLSYKWYHVNRKTGAYDLIESEGKNSYTVTAGAGSERYVCTAEDNYGNTYEKHFVWYMNTLEFKYEGEVMVPLNGEAALEIYASSSCGEITYRWEKYDPENDNADTSGWVKLKGEIASTLQVKNVSKKEKYRCYIDDENEVFSVEFNVSVDVGVKIDPYQQIDNVKIGDQIEMIMIAESAIPEGISLSYKWYHVNRKTGAYDLIESEGKNSYTVTAGAGSEWYVCTAEDNYGNTYRKEFNVSVDTGIERDSYQNFYDVKIGDQVEMIMIDEASIPEGMRLSYKWYHFNKKTKDYDLIESEGKNRYTVTAGAYSAEYKCEAEDNYGNTYRKSFIWYMYTLMYDWDKTQTEVRVPLNGKVILETYASSSLGEIMYRWSRYDPENDNADMNGWVELEGETASTLQVEQVSKKEKYECYIDDGNEDCLVDYIIYADAGVKIDSGQRFDDVKSGDQVQMVMTDEASIPEGVSLNYKWYHSNRKTGEYDLIESEKSNSYTVTAGAYSEEYRCTAEDNYGNTYDKYFWWWMNTLEYDSKKTQTQVWIPLNGNVVLEMYASSSLGEVTYQWYKMDPENGDEITLEGETSSTLQLENVSKEEEYLCSVWDGNEGFSVGFTIFVIRDAEVKFKNNPTNVSGAKGAKVVLNAEATAKEGTLSYQWFYYDTFGEENVLIPGATKPKYTATIEDEKKRYECIVTDMYGNGHRRTITVWQDYAIILEYGMDQFAQNAKLGQKVTMDVEATIYNGKLSYQWQRKKYKDDGYTWENIPKATKASYTTKAENECYRCRITNGPNVKYVYWTYTIPTGLKVTEPDSMYVKAGQNIILKAEATTKYGELHYQWYKAGKDSNGKSDEEIKGATFQTYVVKNIQKSGRYYCKVSNGYQSKEASFAIYVNSGLKAAAENSSISVREGKKATLKVKASSDASITYQWYKWTYPKTGKLVKLDKATGAAYTTHAITEEEAYSCVVSDGHNEQQVDFEVSVDYGFYAEAEKAVVWVPKGEDAQLKVNAGIDEGYGDLTYSWYDTDWNSFEGENSATYTVKNVTKVQQYICEVQYDYGRNYIWIWVGPQEERDDYGLTYSEAKTLKETVENKAVIPVEHRVAYFKFIPSKTGIWEIYSKSAYSTTTALYDENKNEITNTYDAESYAGLYNFSITEGLRKGKTYYLAARFMSEVRKGSYSVYVRYIGGCEDGMHRWDDGHITQSATCEKAGVKTYTCSICGKTKTEKKAAIGHTYPRKWTVRKAATCGRDGEEYRVCNSCGKEATRKIAATGKHNMKVIVDKVATCGKAGSQHQECSVCHTKKAATAIKATGRHSFDSYATIKKATALAAGTETRTCKVCGKTESRSIAKLAATIKLKANKVTVKTGDSVELGKYVTGLAAGDSVAGYTSSNGKAVVSKTGKVTGKAVGTTTVTVKLASGKTAKITVTVAAPTPTGMKNVPASKNLAKGKTFVLKPILLPAGAKGKITYKSSNTKVATVDARGRITAKGKGTAQITITVGKVKKTCKVTVK